jgi:hypothetical protein
LDAAHGSEHAQVAATLIASTALNVTVGKLKKSVPGKGPRINDETVSNGRTTGTGRLVHDLIAYAKSDEAFARGKLV